MIIFQKILNKIPEFLKDSFYKIFNIFFSTIYNIFLSILFFFKDFFTKKNNILRFSDENSVQKYKKNSSTNFFIEKIIKLSFNNFFFKNKSEDLIKKDYEEFEFIKENLFDHDKEIFLEFFEDLYEYFSNKSEISREVLFFDIKQILDNIDEKIELIKNYDKNSEEFQIINSEILNQMELIFPLLVFLIFDQIIESVYPKTSIEIDNIEKIFQKENYFLVSDIQIV